MALFGGKKNCPNCGQAQEKSWDKCPFCMNMGMAGGGMGGGTGMGMGGPPPGGGMGAAMGGGMAPPGVGFGGPPPPAQGFGGPSTQFGGGGGGYGGPPPGQSFGPPSGGGSAQKTQMFGGGAGSSTQLLGWVVPLKGPHRGELHTLKPQSVIGKDPTCDIVFNDSFLSSRHATIRQQGGVFVLEDHSSNGTYVNDKKITRQELIDSDFVKFGQTLVKFKCL